MHQNQLRGGGEVDCLRVFTAGLCVAAFLSSNLHGSPQRKPRSGFEVRVDVDLVLLNLSARQQATNRDVPGLRKEDFVVYEDGVPQSIEFFAGGEAPFDALLLLDVSGSTRKFLPLMKRAASGFFTSVKPDDAVAIAAFNSSVELVQDFTLDRRDLTRALDRLYSNGGTALYDAVVTCLEEVIGTQRERSAIVVFTDGVDNQLEGPNSEGSRATFSMLLRKVQQADTLIYTIFLDSQPPEQPSHRLPWPIPGRRAPSPHPPGDRRPGQSETYRQAMDQLRSVAEQTGGRMYMLTRIEDLGAAFDQISADMRTQYQIGYVSTNRIHDGRWRQLRVELKDHPGVSVRTRRGYYAPQSSPDRRN